MKESPIPRPIKLLPPANKRCNAPETHFIMEGQRKAHAFSIETCDQCGKQVEAANAITYLEPRQRLLSLGMVEVQPEDRLDEMGYCDALDGCACPDCFVEEPRDSGQQAQNTDTAQKRLEDQ